MLRRTPISTLFPYTTLFRSMQLDNQKEIAEMQNETQKEIAGIQSHFADRKSGSAGMPRPISYAVFCLKKKNTFQTHRRQRGDMDALRSCPSRSSWTLGHIPI